MRRAPCASLLFTANALPSLLVQMLFDSSREKAGTQLHAACGIWMQNWDQSNQWSFLHTLSLSLPPCTQHLKIEPQHFWEPLRSMCWKTATRASMASEAFLGDRTEPRGDRGILSSGRADPLLRQV